MSIDLNRMPKLGFGLMRLPETDGVIDHEQVCHMVDKYMKTGMNYFDTAYIYHGGKSEVAAREALVKRYPRDSFMIATKLPAWEMREEADVERIFNDQLEKTGVDHFDFYLLHSIEDGSNHDAYEEFGSWQFAQEKKEAGLIKHLGFSFHGSPELLKDIMDRHP